VSANSLTTTDKSSENTSETAAALATQKNTIANAYSDYSALLSANSKAYQKALVDNRATWRTEIAAIRTSYYDTLARINAQPKTAANNKKMITDKSTALKVMSAAQKKSAADYRASQPAAAAARDAANKTALDAKSAAIAKANATYGTFIESIGYGVLIP
jgi:chromosome segregation ATPase